jgi:hypothetical protein
MFKRVFCLLCLLINFGVFAQQGPQNEPYISTEASSFIGSGSQTPHWLRANNLGTTPLDQNFLQVKASYIQEYDSTTKALGRLKKFGLAYGTQLVANVGINQSSFILPIIFAKARYGAFELALGRQYKQLSVNSSSLSSGHIVRSNNATPLPGISVSIPNYTSILGKGFVSIKGSFTHEYFGKQDHTKEYYLHQKTFYGKLGKENHLINVEAGINNMVTWGGYSFAYATDTLWTVNGYFANDFNAFLGNAFPFPAIRTKFPSKIQLAEDNLNYGGNVLGSLDFNISLNSKFAKFIFYKQTPYDLGSFFTGLVNADDGLYGLSILPKHGHIINNIAIEGFHTFNQGRYRSNINSILGLPDKHFGEQHNYWNHGQYIDGWSYNDRPIGSPLIYSNVELFGEEAKKGRNYNFTKFNKAKVFYLALSGELNKIAYTLKFNHGKYKVVYDPTAFEKQTNVGVFLQYKLLGNQSILFNTAYDNGTLFKNTLGTQIGFRKNW